MVSAPDMKKIVLYAGELDGFAPNCQVQNLQQNPTNQVWTFHSSTFNWTRNQFDAQPPAVVPQAVKRHGCVVLGGNMVAVGGWNFTCPTNTSHIQTFSFNMYMADIS